MRCRELRKGILDQSAVIIFVRDTSKQMQHSLHIHSLLFSRSTRALQARQVCTLQGNSLIGGSGTWRKVSGKTL
jgi:hypothetical protein